ncbi:unnamed protein product, partial [Discosporangium mesarthrocarpum]
GGRVWEGEKTESSRWRREDKGMSDIGEEGEGEEDDRVDGDGNGTVWASSGGIPPSLDLLPNRGSTRPTPGDWVDQDLGGTSERGNTFADGGRASFTASDAEGMGGVDGVLGVSLASSVTSVPSVTASTAVTRAGTTSALASSGLPDPRNTCPSAGEGGGGQGSTELGLEEWEEAGKVTGDGDSAGEPDPRQIAMSRRAILLSKASQRG